MLTLNKKSQHLGRGITVYGLPANLVLKSAKHLTVG